MPPRRTSQAVKKDAEAAETKNEGSGRRRSGRAVTKTSEREASRSRRSSTAAQTAASVADSKTPKGKGSVSRRDSTSPSELSASRIKAARRSTGRINYKESDGEEEVPAPKFDENFNSGDEFDESESDEKSKPKGRGKVAKSPAKSRSTAKSKASTSSRRGRPSKKEVDDEEVEEKETVDISDDSGEPEVITKKAKVVKEKQPPKSSRSRRQKKEVVENKPEEEKPKPSRRSGRASSSKEESAKKRPSRSVQAKRYTEDDDIEEVEEEKVEEEVDGGKRKRKRGASPQEASKRLKEDENVEDAKDVEEDDEVAEEKAIEEKSEEAMEVDEPSVDEEPSETKTDDVKTGQVIDAKIENTDNSTDVIEDKKKDEELSSPPKEDTDALNKKESVESLENVESMDSSYSEPEPKIEESKPEISPAKKEEPKSEEKVDEKSAETPMPETPKTSQPIEDKPLNENTVTPPIVPDTKPEEIAKKVESASDPKTEQEEACKYDSPASDEGKPLTIDETASSPKAATITQSKETIQDAVLNGSEKTDAVPNTAHDIQKSPIVNSELTEKSTPTENGAHNDVQHTNSSSSPADQCYSLPGRKYVLNSNLSDSLKQSIKDKTFGFVSYNLGVSNSDAYLQKEKLLNELNSLDARIICLQQVAKPFYSAVLEPSLDALGFKSTFSQPEDSLKGVATFYKTSVFRLAKKTEISLKQLIEKELESTLSPEDGATVKNHIKKCGSVLLMQFSTVIGSSSFSVANVQIPPTDLSVHALQVSCLAKEVVRIHGGTTMPLLLGGEFNLSENDASYQLLRDGYLSNDMIEELQKRNDLYLPASKEYKSLVNLLWKSFQHPSSDLCSCYKSVLDREFSIPGAKRTSPDLLWFSSNSLHTVGVLDIVLEKPEDHCHFSLKADVAFIV